MYIHCVGYNHSHDMHFEMNRPQGLNHWLLLIIKTPAEFEINGRHEITRASSFLLLTEGTPYCYRTHSDLYTDDWMHFNMSEAGGKLIEELQLPLNTVTWLGDDSEISLLMKNITQEFYAPNTYHQDIAQAYLKVLLLKIHLQLKQNEQRSNLHLRQQDYLALRKEIYASPEAILTVDQIADRLFISRSSFQHTYKRLFGVSIMEDIIASRLQRVKELLLTTTLTLPEIARRSGYNNECHLIRQFKQHYKITPTQFRRR